MVVLRLPEPMLARADAIPSGSGWTFEPKLDGFRCLVGTHAGCYGNARYATKGLELLLHDKLGTARLADALTDVIIPRTTGGRDGPSSSGAGRRATATRPTRPSR